MTYELLCGDTIEMLRTMEAESVQCCVTSPPYFGSIRDYGVEGQYGQEESLQEYIDLMVRVFSELKRVLRKDGTLFLNIGDKHFYGKSKIPKGLKPTDLIMVPARVAIAIMESGWYLHNEIIWHKPDPMPESVKNRFAHCHEKVYFFSKSSKYYFNDEAIKEDCVNVENRPNGCERHKEKNYKSKYNGTGMLAGFRTSSKQDGTNDSRYEGFNNRHEPRTKRNGRDIWTITTKGTSLSHYAVFPEKLCERPIIAGTSTGDTVLDPFCGTCISGVVAIRLGCHYVGIDLNPKYIEMGRNELDKIHQRLF